MNDQNKKVKKEEKSLIPYIKEGYLRHGVSEAQAFYWSMSDVLYKQIDETYHKESPGEEWIYEVLETLGRVL